MYLSVQNELVAAYNELRNRRALELGVAGLPKMNFIQMEAFEKDVNHLDADREKVKKVIDRIKLEYPEKLSEVQSE